MEVGGTNTLLKLEHDKENETRSVNMVRLIHRNFDDTTNMPCLLRSLVFSTSRRG